MLMLMIVIVLVIVIDRKELPLPRKSGEMRIQTGRTSITPSHFQIGRVPPVRAGESAGRGLPALPARLIVSTTSDENGCRASVSDAEAFHSRNGCGATAGLSNALQFISPLTAVRGR